MLGKSGRPWPSTPANCSCFFLLALPIGEESSLRGSACGLPHDHPCRHGAVGGLIHEDERPCLAIGEVRVNEERLGGAETDAADLVEGEAFHPR